MLNGLKEKIFSIKSAIGIELTIETDNNHIFKFIVLENVKGSIVIKEQGRLCSSLTELISQLPKNTPVCLNISGKGILYKKINELNNKETAKIMQAALPSANPADFYMQYYLDENFGLVQIAKKSLIEPIIKSFQKEGFYIVDISFGGFPLINLIPIINRLKDREFAFLGGYELELNDGKIANLKLNSSNADELTLIGDGKVQNTKLIAYASALQVFLGNVLFSNIDEITFWKQEFIHKQLYSKLILGIVGLFLFALLVNFYFFNLYSAQNVQYQSEKHTNEKVLELASQLEKKFEEKEKFLKSSGWLNPSKLSYFADRIASNVPSGITIFDLSINPVDNRKYKEQKIIEFTEGSIRISGNCKRSVELNEWIKKLSNLDFINHVDVKNYSHDEYENLGKFELEISIK